LEAKTAALAHEETSLNIMAAMVADLSLVRVAVELVDQVLLVVLELDTAVVVEVLQMSQQHQTTLVELASKVLSESRSITNENSHYEF
jgi:citrate lyase alpha subunit